LTAGVDAKNALLHTYLLENIEGCCGLELARRPDVVIKTAEEHAALAVPAAASAYDDCCL
jgi:hypothetical protein